MMTKALTGLFFLGSATCLALCAYKRIQCKKDAPSEANTRQPSTEKPSVTN